MLSPVIWINSPLHGFSSTAEIATVSRTCTCCLLATVGIVAAPLEGPTGSDTDSHPTSMAVRSRYFVNGRIVYLLRQGTNVTNVFSRSSRLTRFPAARLIPPCGVSHLLSANECSAEDVGLLRA